jgi:hypothetical protein
MPGGHHFNRGAKRVLGVWLLRLAAFLIPFLAFIAWARLVRGGPEKKRLANWFFALFLVSLLGSMAVMFALVFATNQPTPHPPPLEAVESRQ